MGEISYDLLPLGSIKISAWYPGAVGGAAAGLRRADPAHRVRTAVVRSGHCVHRAWGGHPANPLMLSVKNELLRHAPATALDAISPGAGARRPLKPPRWPPMATLPARLPCNWPSRSRPTPALWASSSRPRLKATPAYQHWVDAIEIAGPGFLNIRLKPAAKQEVVREVLGAGERFGYQPSNGPERAGRVRLGQPHRPAARGPWPPGRHWRRHQQPLQPPRAGACTAKFDYNDAGVQIDTLTKSTQLRAKGFKPGDDCWPTDSDNPLAKNFYNGDYIADIAEAFKAKATVKADDREFTANGDVG